MQGTGISPGLHFHLSATINGLTDIPLVPAMNSCATDDGVGSHKFVLHWLNNKEMYFSLEAGRLLRDLARLALDREDSGVEQELAESVRTGGGGGAGGGSEGGGAEGGAGSGLSHTPSITSFNTDISQPSSASGPAHQLSLSEALDQRIESLLREWHHRYLTSYFTLVHWCISTALTCCSPCTRWTARCWSGLPTFWMNISLASSDRPRSALLVYQHTELHFYV